MSCKSVIFSVTDGEAMVTSDRL